MSSDSDSDCVITDYKEGDSCIIVTDIPAKRCKLEPEETPKSNKNSRRWALYCKLFRCTF